jgi:hypothetical protein
LRPADTLARLAPLLRPHLAAPPPLLTDGPLLASCLKPLVPLPTTTTSPLRGGGALSSTAAAAPPAVAGVAAAAEAEVAGGGLLEPLDVTGGLAGAPPTPQGIAAGGGNGGNGGGGGGGPSHPPALRLLLDGLAGPGEAADLFLRPGGMFGRWTERKTYARLQARVKGALNQ